jgi:hypothetical protein
MRRRRIWCELLPHEELAHPSTIGLLERFGLEPLIALPPHRQDPALASALARLDERGIPIGVWPLLSDEDGYWPSEGNSARFLERVREAIAFVRSAGASVRTLAVDLEPPLDVTSELMKGDLLHSGRILAKGLLHLPRPERIRAHRRALVAYAEIERELAADGIESVAAVVPTLVFDFASGTHLWQSLLKTPVSGPRWSVVSPMLYTSQIAFMLPSRNADDARAMLYALSRLLRTHLGDRASVSLGLVGTGKLGDEHVFSDPEELARDVELTLAAGVDDLALFSLEGVLRSGAPERWLIPYTTATARPPQSLRAGVVSGVVRAVVWASKPWSFLV